MYLERRLWEHTEGVRGRIVLATVIGLLAAGVGVARLALLGWLIAKVFSGAELAELVWPIIAIGAVMILRGALEYWRVMIAHNTAAIVQKI